jgi:hypothetical protein
MDNPKKPLFTRGLLRQPPKVNDVVLGRRTLSCHVSLMHGDGWGVHRLSTRDVTRIEANVARFFNDTQLPLAGSPPQVIMRADGSFRVLIWPHCQHRPARDLWTMRHFLLSRGASEGRERPNFHVSIDSML